MKTMVVYKSKYGSTKQYAEWIAEAIGCEAKDAKGVKIEELEACDAIVYGGGLYAEVIAGVNLITKHFDKLQDKKIAVFTTGITPMEYREYYDKMVLEKNFTSEMAKKIRIFNYPGKMILKELSLPHRAALISLKKIMSGKENPTEMEQLLVKLCDADGDFSDKSLITELVEYIKQEA